MFFAQISNGSIDWNPIKKRIPELNTFKQNLEPTNSSRFIDNFWNDFFLLLVPLNTIIDKNRRASFIHPHAFAENIFRRIFVTQKTFR